MHLKDAVRVGLAVVAAVTLSRHALAGQATPEQRVSRAIADPKFQTAMAAIDRDHDRLVQEIVTLTEIPAPPFKEDARGQAYLGMLRTAGLTDVERDTEGNVMGLRRGTGPAGAPLVAVVAHLDTVFPEGTNVKVTRKGTRLVAPGIGDNVRSLAVVLAIIRAMNEAQIQTASDILFVGNVGEEGPGDLRGVKFLLTKGKYKDRIKQFIAVDGAGTGAQIVNAGIGSKRYRVTYKGPGGHSWGAFGLVNPAYAMGAAMQQMAAIRVPATPKTTFNIGVMGGGTSVNSIPLDAWMEIDMRSESPVELEKLETLVLTTLREAARAENGLRSTTEGSITVDFRVIGDRPSGRTAVDVPLVRAAIAAAKAAGLEPALSAGSTDANFPISLGIPAICLDSGGTGDRAHALDEWIDVEKSASLKGIRVILATLLGVS